MMQIRQQPPALPLVPRLTGVLLGIALIFSTGATPASQDFATSWWWGFMNDPARTARVFTRDVVREAIREGPPFDFNTLPTALPYSDSPAYADILVDPASNFLACEGGPFALCFYSGPEGPLPCRTAPQDPLSECTCLEIPYGIFFVDIYAILDEETYRETVSVCGADGSGCAKVNSAPVCGVISSGKLFPGADMISVFSANCALEEQIGNTLCVADVYAGCMTAPCYRRPYMDDGAVECLCPNYDGPYQVGQDLAEPVRDCDLGAYNVWSASYNIGSSGGGAERIVPEVKTPDGQCRPDLPPPFACPLLPVPTPLTPDDPLCQLACDQYAQCKRDNEIQVGFTCDATLCTVDCTDRGLVGPACNGLGSCGKEAIIEVERISQCSCCASQICGCESNERTQYAIYDLNERQRQGGGAPQCDINGTLCGTPPPADE